MSYDPVCESGAMAPSRLCQLLCPPSRQMGTVAHRQPHAMITTKLFCFISNVENRRVVLSSAPALETSAQRPVGKRTHLPGEQTITLRRGRTAPDAGALSSNILLRF